MDIYKGAKSDSELTAKHQISTRTRQSCRILNYTDEDNFSKMNAAPTMQDAVRLIKKNAEMQRNSKKKLRLKREKIKGQLHLNLPVVKTKQAKQVKQSDAVKPATREINILWGAIKIKL